MGFMQTTTCGVRRSLFYMENPNCRRCSTRAPAAGIRVSYQGGIVDKSAVSSAVRQ